MKLGRRYDMKASGNGNPMQCVSNLIRLVRGEVPYQRCKGLDPRLIDRPYSTVRSALKKDVIWTIQTYEPRADIKSIDIDALMEEQGAYELNIYAAEGS